jgi:hypothetical protein
LRDPEILVPRILVVVRVPDNVSEWADATDDRLLIRRCGYRVSLRGMSETENAETVSVTLERENRFTPESLSEMMSVIGEGGAP